MRSVLNLKYSEKLVKKAQNLGFKVSFYDRRKEPEKIKAKEGGTIPWGIKTAIERINDKPDIIYHLGDWGKEPMILIFGENPEIVLRKLKVLIE